MYWPLGAPRIYAAAKKRRKIPEADEKDDDKEKGKVKEGAAIIALRVSRNGQLFATVTATTLTLWQTSVRIRHCQSDRF